MKKLSTFAYLSKKLIERESFAANDYKKIITITNTEKLFELIKLKNLLLVENFVPQYRQVIFIPIAANIEKYGSYFTIKDAINRIIDSNQLLLGENSLSIAIDRWHGKFLLPDLLSVINEIKETCPIENPCSFVYPSTYDILTAIGGRNETICFYSAVEDILREFFTHGFTNIDGGQDLIIHKIAADMGFTCCIAHVVKLHSLRKSIIKYYNNFLLPDILYITNEILSPNKHHKWFLTIDQPLAKLSDNTKNKISSNLIRLIAVARIILPNVCKLRLPLSRFNQNFSTIAKMVQAEDIGDFALDKNTAEILQISEINPLYKYLNPTSL